MTCLQKLKTTEQFSKCCAESGSPLDAEGMKSIQTNMLTILADTGDIDMQEAGEIMTYISTSTLPAHLRADVLSSVKHRVVLNVPIPGATTRADTNTDEHTKNINHYRLQHLLPKSLWEIIKSEGVNHLSVGYTIVKHALNCDLKYVRGFIWPIIA